MNPHDGTPQRMAAAPPRADRSAVAALALGVAAVAALLVAPLPAMALGIAAVCAGLVARRRLRADPELLGSRRSLLGVILGGGVALLILLPFALPWLLVVLPH